MPWGNQWRRRLEVRVGGAVSVICGARGAKQWGDGRVERRGLVRGAGNADRAGRVLQLSCAGGGLTLLPIQPELEGGADRCNPPVSKTRRGSGAWVWFGPTQERRRTRPVAERRGGTAWAKKDGEGGARGFPFSFFFLFKPKL